MNYRTIMISAVPMAIAIFLLANLHVEKVNADEVEQSMEASWDKLSSAERTLIMSNPAICMDWLDYTGRPYGLEDLPAALAAFQEATEYRDRYQQMWPSVDWKNSGTELYMMFKALSGRSTHRYENRDLTFASTVWTELTLQAEWCEKRSEKPSGG